MNLKKGDVLYHVVVDDDLRLIFACDLSQSSGRIIWQEDPADEWNSCPFSVANGSHSRYEIAEILNDWLGSEGGRLWDEDDYISVVPVGEEVVH